MNCSVVMSVYNGGEMLKKSLSSLLNQTNSNFIIYIIDDFSTDGSDAYLKTICDKRVIIFYNQINKGLFVNLNYLIKQVESDIITLWSQDDIMYENCIDETIRFHELYQNIAFSYSDRDIINNEGEYVNKYDNWDVTPELIPTALHLKIAWYTGSIAGNISNTTYKKWVFKEYGYFKENYSYAADFDFQLRVGVYNSIGKIRKTLFALRSHSGQLSKKPGFAINQLIEDISIFNFMKKHTGPELLNFANDCIKWRRSIYYLAVLINEIKSHRFKDSLAYFINLNKFQFVGFIAIRFVLTKIGLGKKINLWQDNFNNL